MFPQQRKIRTGRAQLVKPTKNFDVDCDQSSAVHIRTKKKLKTELIPEEKRKRKIMNRNDIDNDLDYVLPSKMRKTRHLPAAFQPSSVKLVDSQKKGHETYNNSPESNGSIKATSKNVSDYAMRRANFWLLGNDLIHKFQMKLRKAAENNSEASENIQAVATDNDMSLQDTARDVREFKTSKNSKTRSTVQDFKISKNSKTSGTIQEFKTSKNSKTSGAIQEFKASKNSKTSGTIQEVKTSKNSKTSGTIQEVKTSKNSKTQEFKSSKNSKSCSTTKEVETSRNSEACSAKTKMSPKQKTKSKQKSKEYGKPAVVTSSGVAETRQQTMECRSSCLSDVPSRSSGTDSLNDSCLDLSEVHLEPASSNQESVFGKDVDGLPQDATTGVSQMSDRDIVDIPVADSPDTVCCVSTTGKESEVSCVVLKSSSDEVSSVEEKIGGKIIDNSPVLNTCQMANECVENTIPDTHSINGNDIDSTVNSLSCPEITSSSGEHFNSSEEAESHTQTSPRSPQVLQISHALIDSPNGKDTAAGNTSCKKELDSSEDFESQISSSDNIQNLHLHENDDSHVSFEVLKQTAMQAISSILLEFGAKINQGDSSSSIALNDTVHDREKFAWGADRDTEHREKAPIQSEGSPDHGTEDVAKIGNRRSKRISKQKPKVNSKAIQQCKTELSSTELDACSSSRFSKLPTSQPFSRNYREEPKTSDADISPEVESAASVLTMMKSRLLSCVNLIETDRLKNIRANEKSQDTPPTQTLDFVRQTESYICETCGKGFFRLCVLKEHMSEHDAERRLISESVRCQIPKPEEASSNMTSVDDIRCTKESLTSLTDPSTCRSKYRVKVVRHDAGKPTGLSDTTTDISINVQHVAAEKTSGKNSVLLAAETNDYLKSNVPLNVKIDVDENPDCQDEPVQNAASGSRRRKRKRSSITKGTDEFEIETGCNFQNNESKKTGDSSTDTVENSHSATDVKNLSSFNLSTIDVKSLVNSMVCPICGRKFSNHGNMQKHVRMQHNFYRPHKCPTCGKGFPYPSSLEAHMTKHATSPKKLLMCEACGKAFVRASSLRKHVKEHHEDARPYICHLCDRRFVYLCALKNHLHSHSDERTFACDQCDSVFKHASNLQTHVRKMHRGKCDCAAGSCVCKAVSSTDSPALKCDVCAKTFFGGRQYRLHLRSHEGKARLVCKVCELEFPTNLLLMKHMVKEHETATFNCDVCSRKFLSSQSLEMHRITHQRLKVFQCETCGKRYSSKNSLMNHTALHAENLPFSCSTCAKEFTHQEKLTRHMLTHRKDKTFVCCHCDSKFKTRVELHKHIIQHDEQKKFICEFCSKAFLHESYLKMHITKHTGDRPHSCEVCGRCFGLKTNLRRHMRKHRKKNGHICGESSVPTPGAFVTVGSE